jgi:hypothetical protein
MPEECARSLTGASACGPHRVPPEERLPSGAGPTRIYRTRVEVTDETQTGPIGHDPLALERPFAHRTAKTPTGGYY